MLKQKKGIIAILLALCFLLSVTAGAAAASDNNFKENKFDKHNDKKFDKHNDKKFDKHNDKCFKKVWIKGFWEKKVVKKVFYKHGHRVVVKEVIKKWHPGHWKIIKIPCKHDGRR